MTTTVQNMGHGSLTVHNESKKETIEEIQEKYMCKSKDSVTWCEGCQHKTNHYLPRTKRKWISGRYKRDFDHEHVSRRNCPHYSQI